MKNPVCGIWREMNGRDWPRLSSGLGWPVFAYGLNWPREASMA